jgi:hypothetical protein
VQGRNAAWILSARTDVEADVTPFSHALRSVPSSAGRVCAIWVCASGPHHHGEEDEAGGSRRQKVECEHHHLRAPGRHSEVGSAADHHARASREGTATGSSIEVARRLNQIKRSSAAGARTSRRPSAGALAKHDRSERRFAGRKSIFGNGERPRHLRKTESFMASSFNPFRLIHTSHPSRHDMTRRVVARAVFHVPGIRNIPSMTPYPIGSLETRYE